MALKIRERHLTGYRREAGGYTGWHEWQLVDGRKVVGRFDLYEQAEAAKTKRESDGTHKTTGERE